jgi:hypothetical protein
MIAGAVKRSIAPTLLPCLLLWACAPPSPEVPPVSGPDERASCQSYDAVDRAALARYEAQLPKRLARAAEVARELGVSLTPPAGFEARRVVGTELNHGWITDGVTIAFGSGDGRWWLRSRHSLNTEYNREGPMPAAAVAELEAALGQDCLYSEPVYMPDAVPMKDGSAPKCFDGASTVLQIETPGRRRSSYQLCHGWGYTEEVRIALHHAVRPPPGD